LSAPSIDCVERIALSTQCGQSLSATKNAHYPILASAMKARRIDLILASLALLPFAIHLFFPVIRIVDCSRAFCFGSFVHFLYRQDRMSVGTPARISAATQIASISSSRVAPWRRAALV
jgi:hypothetical protein